jgi:hypothetical protein
MEGKSGRRIHNCPQPMLRLRREADPLKEGVSMPSKLIPLHSSNSETSSPPVPFPKCVLPASEFEAGLQPKPPRVSRQEWTAMCPTGEAVRVSKLGPGLSHAMLKPQRRHILSTCCQRRVLMHTYQCSDVRWPYTHFRSSHLTAIVPDSHTHSG